MCIYIHLLLHVFWSVTDKSSNKQAVWLVWNKPYQFFYIYIYVAAFAWDIGAGSDL